MCIRALFQVLHVDDLERQLESAEKEYLKTTVRVNVDHNQVELMVRKSVLS